MFCYHLLDVSTFRDFKYDHNVFPGAIPRTFAGSVLLSWLTAPFVHAGISLGVITSKFDVQIGCMSFRYPVPILVSLSVLNTEQCDSCLPH